MIILIRIASALTGALAFANSVCAQPKPGDDFPPGPGRDIVLSTCGGCHAIDRLKAGYTATGWRTILEMKRNFDAPVAPENYETVAQYLIKSFPERPRPQAVVVAGPVQATIKQWQVPTRGSRPHDPVATRDGHIWWTGQLSNRLGRLDPKTGSLTEFYLKTKNSGPHGLTEDGDGNIWFTANHAAYIGKLDERYAKAPRGIVIARGHILPTGLSL